MIEVENKYELYQRVKLGDKEGMITAFYINPKQRLTYEITWDDEEVSQHFEEELEKA